MLVWQAGGKEKEKVGKFTFLGAAGKKDLYCKEVLSTSCLSLWWRLN